MQSAGRGRPRKNPAMRHGNGTYEEILDAAAEMFSTRGFAATSMNQIATAVGVGQNSIYHHFGSKLGLLKTLLVEGVAPGLQVASALAEEVDDATEVTIAGGLYALAITDAAVLVGWRWNLGALYLLPETRSPELAEFQAQRHALQKSYVDLSRALTVRTGSEDVGDQVFRLVVSIINMRWDNEVSPETPRLLARSGLRICGWVDPMAQVEAEACRLLNVLREREISLPAALSLHLPGSVWT